MISSNSTMEQNLKTSKNVFETEIVKYLIWSQKTTLRQADEYTWEEQFLAVLAVGTLGQNKKWFVEDTSLKTKKDEEGNALNKPIRDRAFMLIEGKIEGAADPMLEKLWFSSGVGTEVENSPDFLRINGIKFPATVSKFDLTEKGIQYNVGPLELNKLATNRRSSADSDSNEGIYYVPNETLRALYQAGLNIIRIIRYLLHKTLKSTHDLLVSKGLTTSNQFENWKESIRDNPKYGELFSSILANMPTVYNKSDYQSYFYLGKYPNYVLCTRGHGQYLKSFDTLAGQESDFVASYLDFKKSVSLNSLFSPNVPSSNEMNQSFLPPEVFRDHPHRLNGQRQYEPWQYINRSNQSYNDPFVAKNKKSEGENYQLLAPLHKKLGKTNIRNNVEAAINAKFDLDLLKLDVMNKLEQLESIELSEDLSWAIQENIIDINFVSSRAYRWKQQIMSNSSGDSSEGLARKNSKDKGSKLSKKYLDWSKFEIDQPLRNALIDYDLIVPVGIPYGTNSPRNLIMQYTDPTNPSQWAETVSWEQLTAAERVSNPIDTRDFVWSWSSSQSEKLKALVYLFYGLDFSEDNFPTDPSVLEPIFPEILLSGDEKWPWAKSPKFENRRPKTPVDSRYYSSPYLFSEYHLRKTVSSKIFSSIELILVKTDIVPCEFRLKGDY